MLAEAPVPVICQNEWSVEHDWELKELCNQKSGVQAQFSKLEKLQKESK